MTEPASPRATSDDSPAAAGVARDEATEAFGQAGVRQYAGPVVHWVCLVFFAVAIAFWYRSGEIADEVSLRRQNQVTGVRSISGHLRLHLTLYETRRFGNSRWEFRSLPIGRRVYDVWPEGPLRRIGIQFRMAPLDPSAAGGFWVRVKWYLVAGVCAIFPVCRGVLRWRRKRRGE